MSTVYLTQPVIKLGEDVKKKVQINIQNWFLYKRLQTWCVKEIWVELRESLGNWKQTQNLWCAGTNGQNRDNEVNSSF